MSLRLLHRRLAVSMAIAGLIAFAGGAGLEPFSAIIAGALLVTALFWHPGRLLSTRIERAWLPLAAILVVRALLHVFIVRGDVVVPVVDLLLLLMAAEALRSLEAPNDVRLYALSFALLLASTAYRPGVLFLIAFASYVILATVALMVGHLRRNAERHGVREVPLDRRMLATTTALSGVILVIAGIVFVTFPRVSRGWTGRGEIVATSIAGFTDEISLAEHGSRIYGNPQIVLRVEFPGGAPGNLGSLHWRGRSYDSFDGVRWSRSRTLPPTSRPTQWYLERWDTDVIEQRIYGAPLDVRALFTLHPVLDIRGENGTQPLFDAAGDFVYWGAGAPAYTAFSRAGSPSPEQLRATEEGYLPSARHFLQTPRDLDPRIPALADSLTAGLVTRYDKVVTIERWLRSFDYTLELPATASEATLEHFLFERRTGHCEYFSSAMVILLRAVGIEARNVNGFLGGEWNQLGNYLVVTQNQAHSWVEVWFPDYGWVTFDPTPAGAGTGERTTAWFWPGRILYDALQHRWSKWILDFNVESQAGLFQRWSTMLTSEQTEDGGTDGRRGLGLRFWGVAALALVGLVALWRAKRDGMTLTPETRMYVRLRESCERSGLMVPPGLTPLALVERVRGVRPGAARAAERVVDLYLRSRYGGESLGPSERREMSEALGAARRTLRTGTRQMASSP